MQEQHDVRLDTKTEDGSFVAIWGLNLPGHHPFWSHYLMMVYDLREREGVDSPIIHLEGATHEVTLFAVDPKTPIDFTRNLFEQKGVSPLMPANHGYQFIAVSDAAAQERISEIAMRMAKNEISADTDFRQQWDALFADGKTLRVSAL